MCGVVHIPSLAATGLPSHIRESSALVAERAKPKSNPNPNPKPVFRYKNKPNPSHNPTNPNEVVFHRLVAGLLPVMAVHKELNYCVHV